MSFACQTFLLAFLMGLIITMTTASTTYDPDRFLLSRGKPTVQSSTDGPHVASYATDGDFNNFVSPYYFSKTTASDFPYLQVDLERNFYIVHIAIVMPKDPDITYTNMRISIGRDAALDSASATLLCDDRSLYRRYDTKVRKWGRYVTVQRMATNTELRVSELAVFDMPLENLAYSKPTDATDFQIYCPSSKAVDMNLGRQYYSKHRTDPWIRVDLGDIYLVHEVLIIARMDCCNEHRLSNVEIRVGNSLSNNGNSNPFCVAFSIFSTQIRSFYCDMFGRFVNLLRRTTSGKLEVNEIIVNPESTANLVRNISGAYGNVGYVSGHGPWTISDKTVKEHFQSKNQIKVKQVWLEFKENYVIAMVYVISTMKHGFGIRIGSSATYEENAECVPGVLTMDGLKYRPFFCEQPITGNRVYLHLHDAYKILAVREILVYEETKPAVIDVITDRYKWHEENTDLTLSCDVGGYPAPVVSWVRDKTVLESGSTTLLLHHAKYNESGVYECWANNTHGVDARQFEVRIASKLRVCAEHVKELQYKVATSTLASDSEIRGTHWYSLNDPHAKHFLQFRQSLPPKHVSSCEVWLNGDHPKVQEGVVSRSLCVKNETNDCSSTINVYTRRCAAHFIYNFHNLRSTTGLKFCFENTPHAKNGGLHPAMASPVKNHALSQKAFHTEPEVGESHQCLIMCQLDARCKSFNHSKKLKICELDSATKSEFPGNYAFQADYDYHHMRHGAVMSVNREL